jgi:threonine/homoserine/homoserine lactone efflux protein
VPSLATLLVFAAASALLAVIPGPNVLYLLARGVTGGRAAAVRAVFGLHAATACFVAAAACGLTALLVSSAVAFSVVKYAGAAYLLYLGIRSLRPRRAGTPAGRSFLVGISNPKVAVFVAAFLPQFGSSWSEVLVLGVEFLLVAVTVDLGWALLAGTLGQARWLRRATAPIYLTLGTYAAVTA